MRNGILVMAGLVAFTMGCASMPKEIQAPAPAPAKAPVATQPLPGPVKAEAAKVPAAPAAKTDPSTLGKVSCSKDKDQRQIELETVTPKGCNLWYTKHGARDKIASSGVASTHCETVRDRIRGKLEKDGFKCANPTLAKPPVTPETPKAS